MATKASWCWCPSCHNILVLRIAGGHTRAFPLGLRGKAIISSLIAEAEENPETRAALTRIIDEARSRGLDREPDEIAEEAVKRSVGRPKKNREA